SSLREIHGIAARWRPKIGAAVRSGALRLRLAQIVAAPCYRRKSGVLPPSANRGAVPRAAVVEDENQTALVLPAEPLHHVEVVIAVEDLSIPAGVIPVHADEGVDAAYLTRQRVIVLPEHAGIALMRQNKGIGQHLV